MKKLMLFLSAVLALSLIAGCAFSGPAARPTGTPDSTTPTTLSSDPTTVPTDPTTVPTDPTTVPTDPPEPTEPPLMAEMRSLLSSGWFNQALTSTYSGYYYADLYELFYNGFPEDSREPTAEEWALLKNIPGFEEGLDLIRLPVSRINETFFEYFNHEISWRNEGLEKFTYLESTDCYYFMRPAEDTNAVTNFTIISAKWNTADDIYVLYTRDDSHHRFCLRLKYDNGKHYVVSNTFALDDEFESVFANLPEPENYHYAFEVVTHNWESNRLAKFILELFLEDPDTFVKYIALEKKGSYEPAHAVSLVFRQIRGTEELKQFGAACKRIANDPASTPDEQWAAFMMTWQMTSQAEARSYILQALEKKTPLDDYTVDTCLIKLNPERGWVAQFYPYPYIYSSLEEFQYTMADHKKNEFYDMTVTNGLCPESYEQLAATYDADFFEKNVLIRIDVPANKDVLPVVTKVTAGPETYWNAPLSVYMEFDETNREDLTHYVLLIAVPREHYRPALYITPCVDCISNGPPHIW